MENKLPKLSGSITLPDFYEFARILVNRIKNDSRPLKACECIQTVKYELEQQFIKGYYLGLNQGWAIERENDNAPTN